MIPATVAIDATDRPDPDLLAFLAQGLAEEERTRGNDRAVAPLAVVARDAEGRRLGAASGFVYLGCLFIDQLFMLPDCRGAGLGGRLIAAIEAAAKARGALISTVNTLDERARQFYERQGYALEFTRTGYRDGRVMHHLGRTL